jgi:hypothetical protein
MGAYATLNIPKFDELLKNSNVVGDGLYSWTEYKILKEKYGSISYRVALFTSLIFIFPSHPKRNGSS